MCMCVCVKKHSWCLFLIGNVEKQNNQYRNSYINLMYGQAPTIKETIKRLSLCNVFAVSACVRVCSYIFSNTNLVTLAVSPQLSSWHSRSLLDRRLLLLLLLSQPTHDETTARLYVGCAHRRGCCTHTGNGKAMQLPSHSLSLTHCHSRSLDFCSRKQTCSSCQCWAGRVACVSFECRIKHLYAHFAVVVLTWSKWWISARAQWFEYELIRILTKISDLFYNLNLLFNTKPNAIISTNYGGVQL